MELPFPVYHHFDLFVTLLSRIQLSQFKMGSGSQRFLAILKKIPLFLWSVKSLILVPLDIYTDVNLAITHFNNGHMVWGGLTVTFLLPSLMFPYHYFHIIKFAADKFKFLFKSSSPSESEKKFIYDREWWIINLNAMMAYFEDIPQFILQVYILWKTPVECFSFDSDWTKDEVIAIQSILTSFLSISATVVPFYKKWQHWYDDKDDWELMSKKGIISFISGTFLNVVPKLVLISWTFSVLNWYGWLFFIPFFLVSCCIACCIPIDHVSGLKLLGYKIIISIQIMFGYSGKLGTVFSAFLLSSFVIPLGIALHAAVNTTDQVDHFAVFPSDPFPSRTICFTNTSILEQQERWQNKTTFFSNNCKTTFSEVRCDQELDGGQRSIILSQLAMMITIPVLLIISASFACVCACCISFHAIFLGVYPDLIRDWG